MRQTSGREKERKSIGRFTCVCVCVCVYVCVCEKDKVLVTALTGVCECVNNGCVSEREIIVTE